jgi:molybdate transport system regulatory protein
MGSIERLGIVPGVKACAVIKATEVMIGKGELRLSARNQFPGKIVSVEEGAVNGIVRIEVLGGNIMTSTISMGAISELGLAPGVEAKAVIKATSVMVGV